ncbi:UNVERIFIED_CONTAM: hypothetical protein K2H54_062087 [Gekko kuhli]
MASEGGTPEGRNSREKERLLGKRMEGSDSKNRDPENGPEKEGDPQIVLSGTTEDLVKWSPRVKQEPDDKLANHWEAQWQEFLKATPSLHSRFEDPPMSEHPSWSDTKSFLASFEEAAEDPGPFGVMAVNLPPADWTLSEIWQRHLGRGAKEESDGAGSLLDGQRNQKNFLFQRSGQVTSLREAKENQAEAPKNLNKLQLQKEPHRETGLNMLVIIEGGKGRFKPLQLEL